VVRNRRPFYGGEDVKILKMLAQSVEASAITIIKSENDSALQ
jgi:hypothetical protein